MAHPRFPRAPGSPPVLVGMVASAVLVAAGGRFGRRAVLRGTGSALATRAVAALPGVTATQATAASAAAFGVAAAMELPWSGALSAVSGLVAMGRLHGREEPLDGILGAAAVGAGAAVASRRLWPVAPRRAAELRPAGGTRRHLATADGDAVAVVVNAGAGSDEGGGPAQQVRRSLPEARVVEFESGDDLMEALQRAADGATVLGAMGGDGTLNAAAGIAHDQGLPLLALPGGTLNHFARDAGLETVEDALGALGKGEVVAVDLASIDGHCFLNTASFGAYVELVDARERLEDRIGKWPAMLVALVQVLGRSQPTEVELDGRRRRLWMIFVGNCAYHPHGFAPSWRTRLDDGQLDVRVVDASMPAARLRLVLAVLSGRLGRCRAYEEWCTRSLHVRRLDADRRLARDGETFEGSAEFTITKSDEPLLVYAPHR